MSARPLISAGRTFRISGAANRLTSIHTCLKSRSRAARGSRKTLRTRPLMTPGITWRLVMRRAGGLSVETVGLARTLLDGYQSWPGGQPGHRPASDHAAGSAEKGHGEGARDWEGIPEIE